MYNTFVGVTKKETIIPQVCAIRFSHGSLNKHRGCNKDWMEEVAQNSRGKFGERICTYAHRGTRRYSTKRQRVEMTRRKNGTCRHFCIRNHRERVDECARPSSVDRDEVLNVEN